MALETIVQAAPPKDLTPAVAAGRPRARAREASVENRVPRAQEGPPKEATQGRDEGSAGVASQVDASCPQPVLPTPVVVAAGPLCDSVPLGREFPFVLTDPSDGRRAGLPTNDPVDAGRPRARAPGAAPKPPCAGEGGGPEGGPRKNRFKEPA